MIKKDVIKKMFEEWGEYPQEEHAKRLGIPLVTYLNWVKAARKAKVKLPDLRKKGRKFNFKELVK